MTYRERHRLNRVDPPTLQTPVRIRCEVQHDHALHVKRRASYEGRSGVWQARQTASKRVRRSPDTRRNVPGVRMNFHLELATPVKSGSSTQFIEMNRRSVWLSSAHIIQHKVHAISAACLLVHRQQEGWNLLSDDSIISIVTSLIFNGPSSFSTNVSSKIVPSTVKSTRALRFSS